MYLLSLLAYTRCFFITLLDHHLLRALFELRRVTIEGVHAAACRRKPSIPRHKPWPVAIDGTICTAPLFIRMVLEYISDLKYSEEPEEVIVTV